MIFVRIIMQALLYKGGDTVTKRIKKYLAARDTLSSTMQYIVDLERGGISSSGGSNVNSTTRVRTSGYVPVEPGRTYTFDLAGSADRRVFIMQYGQGKNYLGSSKASGWINAPAVFELDASAYYVRVVYAFRDDHTINVDDVQGTYIY